jgi:hypothetical protein
MPGTFTPPSEPGFRFSSGKLRIFQGDAVMVIGAWPELRAVRKSAENPRWEAFQPAFRLVKLYRPPAASVVAKRKRAAAPAAPTPGQLDFGFLGDVPPPSPPVQRLTLPEQRRKAFDGFRLALPKDVARAVEPFPSDQWPLLLMLCHDPSSLDLALSNPALAYLLSLKFNGDRELIAALKCGTLRQREILGCLDFPDTAGSANLFRKIEPASVNADNWSRLLDLLRNPDESARRRLAHVPAINTGVVEILLRREASAAAGQRLLQQVAEDPAERHRARVVHLIVNTLTMQETIPARQLVRQFPDRERLEQVHAEVAEAYRRRLQRITEVRKQTRENFGRPPIPPIPGEIEPLSSAEALVDEGETMGNCVAGYAGRVVRGDTYIYRVLKPARSTLSLVRQHSSGLWRVGELEGRFNTPAAESVEKAVAAWLRRYQIEA